MLTGSAPGTPRAIAAVTGAGLAGLVAIALIVTAARRAATTVLGAALAGLVAIALAVTATTVIVNNAITVLVEAVADLDRR